MKSLSNTLSEEEILFLNSLGKTVEIPNDFDFVYEKQVPYAGVALIEGKIEAIKRSKVVETISPAILMGIRQMMNNESVKKSYRIKAGSKIILISKSELIQAIKSPGSKLMKFLSRFL